MNVRALEPLTALVVVVAVMLVAPVPAGAQAPTAAIVNHRDPDHLRMRHISPYALTSLPCQTAY